MKKTICIILTGLMIMSSFSVFAEDNGSAIENQKDTIERGFYIENGAVYDLSGKKQFNVSPDGQLDSGWFLDPNFGIGYPKSEWAGEAIDKAVEFNIIPARLRYGYGDNISREQFCEIAYGTLVYAKAIDELKEYTLKLFDDTDNLKVKSLKLNGIINGKTDTLFAPNDNLTREEAATILYKMACKMKSSIPSIPTEKTFSDESNISPWALDAVRLLKNMSVMQGKDNGNFCPKDAFTKEEAIVTFMRLLDYK